MNDQSIALSSLVMDLKRAALGSDKVTEVFLNEAIKRKTEIDQNVPRYVRNILDSLSKNNDREDLLMYSQLLQNYLQKHE